MNSTTDLRTTHSLELLTHLRRVLADFAQREEKLTREIVAKRNTAQRLQRESAQSIETRLESLLKHAEEAFDARE